MEKGSAAVSSRHRALKLKRIDLDAVVVLNNWGLRRHAERDQSMILRNTNDESNMSRASVQISAKMLDRDRGAICALSRTKAVGMASG